MKQEYLLLEEEDVRLELEQYVEDFESRFDKYYNSPKMGQSDDSEKYVWVNEETGEVIDELPPDEPPTEDSKKSKKDRLKSKSKKVDSVKMKKLFKKLATILHPDRGGSDEDFYKINEAYDEGDLVTLLKYAKEYGIEYEFDTSDSEIFEETEYKFAVLATRLKELSYLNKGLKLSLTDLRDLDDNGEPKREDFYSEGGLLEYVRFLDEARTPILNNPIYVTGKEDHVEIEVAMQYNTGYKENIYSFVNNINTREGGSHVNGFRRAVNRVFTQYGKDSGMFNKLKFAISGATNSQSKT